MTGFAQDSWITAALATVGLSIAVSACTPFSPPIFETRAASADELQTGSQSITGVHDLLSKGDARIVWVHGMCTHNTDFAIGRHDVIVSALSEDATVQYQAEPTLFQRNSEGIRATFSDSVDGKKLETRFLIWSPFTTMAKQVLLEDKAIEDRRAKWNNVFKTGLVNDCLADAIAYLGTAGDGIKDWMRSEVCDVLGGAYKSGNCVLSTRHDARPIIFVTESLGSKMLSDALEHVLKNTSGSRSQATLAEQRLRDVHTVYMLANQIALLGIATPLPAAPSIRKSEATAAQASESTPVASTSVMAFKVFENISARTTFEKAPVTVGPVRFVAFTDPNDLLSDRLISGKTLSPGLRLTNVAVSNAPTWFGSLENPANAHCDYIANQYVMGTIIYGYDGKTPNKVHLPRTKGTCL